MSEEAISQSLSMRLEKLLNAFQADKFASSPFLASEFTVVAVSSSFVLSTPKTMNKNPQQVLRGGRTDMRTPVS